MAVSGRQVLGVDINPYQIAVVEMHGSWPNGHILRADACPTPKGAVNEAGFVDPGAVAQALRELLERMGVGTQEAVFGIAAQQVISRVLEVPAVPDSEMKTVIEGELAHYQILTAQSAAIDYLRLQELDDRAGAIPQVLAVAADQRVINGFTAVADLAGLRLISLEPALSAMYRAAFLQIEAHPTSVCVCVGATCSEIAIVERGQIRLYRPVDIGSDHLVEGRAGGGFDAPHDVGAGRTPTMFGDEDPPQEAAAPGATLVSQNAEYLATEVRRSIDYYRSRHPEAAQISGAVIAIDDPALETLTEVLAVVIAGPVQVARLPVVWAASLGLAARLAPPGDLQFVTASGLAMHELANPPSTLPRFDLSTRQRVDLKVEYSRKRLAGSLIVSILMLCIAIIGGVSIGLKAGAANDDLLTAKADYARLEAIRKQRTEAIEAQIGLLNALRGRGYPLGKLMDSVALAMGPGAGLTEISLNRLGLLTASGESKTETGVIRTLDGLKNSPYLSQTSLQSFGHVASAGSHAEVVKFEVTSQLLGSHPADAAQKSP